MAQKISLFGKETNEHLGFRELAWKVDFPEWFEVYQSLKEVVTEPVDLIKNVSMAGNKELIPHIFTRADSEIYHVTGMVNGFVYSDDSDIKQSLKNCFKGNPDFAYHLLFGRVALSHFEGSNPDPHDYLSFLFQLKEEVEEHNKQEGSAGIVSIQSTTETPEFHFLAIDQGAYIIGELPHQGYDWVRDKFEMFDAQPAYEVIKNHYQQRAEKFDAKSLSSMKDVDVVNLESLLTML